MNISVQQSPECHPSMSHEIGKAVPVHLLCLDHYPHEEMFPKTIEIADPRSPLHNNDAAHCRALVESFRSYGFDCARGMISVYSLFTINPESDT